VAQVRKALLCRKKEAKDFYASAAPPIEAPTLKDWAGSFPWRQTKSLFAFSSEEDGLFFFPL
jgi:hypothetical protein